MHALLVYPEFPETFWSLKYALGFIGKRASLPPLGLLTVAAMLPEDWRLRLVDANVGKLKAGDLAWADIVLISAMTIQRPATEKLIARCRAAGVKMVGGGPLFSCEPEAYPEVDHLVLGECESVLPEFLADLERGEARHQYQAATFPDLATTPLPRWDLLNLKHYANVSLQYSRGCPFDCDFCNITSLFGKRPRLKSSRQVIAELDALAARGWHGGVFFVDDNLLGNRRLLKQELLPALIAWQQQHSGSPFFTEVSINLADDEALMAAMVQAGFDTVFIGIETPDDAGLKECLKQQNRHRDLTADIKKIQRAGMQVQGGFIIGFDSDTPSIFQRQIDFIQNSGITTAMVGLLEAIPGTRLHERLRRENRLQGGRSSGDNVDGETNIVPVMNLDVLKRGYRQIMTHLYSPRHYYQRAKTFLREYKPPVVRARLDRQRIVAFQRSLIRLGLLGRERWQYWRLLIWTLCHRPRLFSTAIYLSIVGHHFRRMCDRHLRQLD